MKSSDIELAWKGFARCEHCSIRDLVLFGDLTAADFNLIHLPIEDVELARESTVFKSGDDGRHVFTLRSGLVKLVQFLPDGQLRILRLVTPGSTFGLEALLGRNYAHTAIVLERAMICRIPRQVVERLQRETPRIHTRLMERWQASLDEADGWLTELSAGKTTERMARLLLRIAEKDDTATAFSREDLGAMLAVTMEHASRTVSEFRRNGVISETPNGRWHCNRPALVRIAAGEG
jgi:CRP-like cAMP-binding protein